MKPPHTIAPLLSCLLSVATCYQQQHVLSAQPLLRNASTSDADAIANVIIAAFSPTPSWQYLYQFRGTHPQEHHRCARSNVLKALADASYRVEVIEAPVESSSSTTRVAAVAMWRHNAWQEGLMFLSRLSAECSHRDMNLTRGYDMERKSIAAKQKYVDEPFGASQLYLELLCTHPEYQLHGAGTRLVKRGLEIGEKERVNVTLAALPTSEGFYAHLGFESVTNLSISSVDEDEWFRYDVMVYDFTDTAVE